MSLKKYNRNSGAANWKIKTDGFEYLKLRELDADTDYPLMGMFVTPDHGYGEGAVLITGNCFVNIPNRYVDTIREMCSDPETVELINKGGESFRYSVEVSKKYKKEMFIIHFN